MSLCVMIPTYNEAENIIPLLDEVFCLGIDDICVLVVDDMSPDGTGRLVEEYGRQHSNVDLLTQIKRHGRGTAGIDGIRWCIEKGADYILEMDADFSHQPRHIPAMLEAIRHADLVLGSRFIKGGTDNDRELHRKIITWLAGMYVRSVLGVKVLDVSSGFRLFRREVLEAIDVDNLISTGPSIVLEILYRAVLLKFKLVEVPIDFVDRCAGYTKLDYLMLIETMVMVLRLREMKKSGKIPVNHNEPEAIV